MVTHIFDPQLRLDPTALVSLESHPAASDSGNFNSLTPGFGMNLHEKREPTFIITRPPDRLILRSIIIRKWIRPCHGLVHSGKSEGDN